MFGYLKARREARRARRQYDLAVLEGPIAENNRRLAELDEMRECRYCKAIESPEDRQECEVQFDPH